MSLRQAPDAKMHGWSGPFYPAGIDDLARLIGKLPRSSGAQYAEFAKLLPDYRGMFRQKTSDFYLWYWMLAWRVGGSTVLLAIPWSQDWRLYDGIAFDRSPAFYCTRNGENHLADIVGQLQKAVRAVAEKTPRPGKGA